MTATALPATSRVIPCGDGTREISTFEPDQLIAFRYRIVREIAKGGMGEVYEAEDLELRQRIALKVMRRERVLRGDGLEQLKREMFLARKVTHPNVCRIFDVGFHVEPGAPSTERTPFITMELIEGETLSERLRRTGPLSVEEALPCIRQMIDALGAAHAAGIVHRDFKSGNVFLKPRVVVTDFGLAMRAHHRGGVTNAISESPEGTPGYMAPEQLAGGTITPATDIYGLGVVIFEMLTGTRPAGPASAAQLGPAWEAVLSHCLARDPEHRFSSVQAVARALPEGASPPRRPWKDLPVHTRMALAIVALVVGAYSGGRIAGKHLAGPTVSAPIAVPTEAEPPQDGRPYGAEAARWYADGLLELRHRDVLAARDRFERVVALEPKCALAHMQLAETYRRLADGPSALESGKKAYALVNDRPLSREEKLLVEGRYREAAGEWPRAVAAYRTLFEFFPRQVEYGIALARAQLSGGSPTDAFATLIKVREATDASADLDIDEAEAEFAVRERDFFRAKAAALRAANTAQTREAWSRAAAAFNVARLSGMAIGKTAEAADSRSKAIALYERAGDRLSRATASLLSAQDREERDDLDAASEMYRDARDAYHELGDRRSEWNATYFLITIAWRQGKVREALELAEGGVALGREMNDRSFQPLRLVMLGAAHFQLGHLDEASALFQESLALAKLQPGAVGPIGVATFYQAELLRFRGDLAGAVALQGPALKQVRLDGLAKLQILNLARVCLLWDLNRPHDAERAASEFASHLPRTQDGDLARAELFRARSFLLMGDVAAARVAFARSQDVRMSAVPADVQWEQEIVRAILLVEQDPQMAEQAIALLEAIIVRSHAFEYYVYELEARLVAGEIEMKSGRIAEGRARLRALAAEAEARGYLRWARKAVTAETSPARFRSGPSSDEPAPATLPAPRPRG